jgi:hypothetical protein
MLPVLLSASTKSSVFGQESNSMSLDMEAISKNLAKGLTFKTISYENQSLIDFTQFKDMQAFMEKAYPLLNSKLEKIVISNYVLLYKWPGSVLSSDDESTLGTDESPELPLLTESLTATKL